MAPPPAADNFGQRQAITTAIKNICQYYPPNTCLRELLQNADDAGATEIEYILDSKSYGGQALLSSGLKDFQGPALLARNNSVFRDEDFESLSTVGDSVKAKDPSTTGKFGQGFNAVYHWTDGPWIYSRNWLLLLDPHEWWSGETGKAGGPRWDVVANRDSVEVQNHLKTFGKFVLDHQQALDQTVIRIPLRTTAQATRSKLFNAKIEVKEIRKALHEFSQEIKEGGLLFLKHIKKVIIKSDSNTLLDAEILDVNGSLKTRERLPQHFKRLYATSSSSATNDLFSSFELAIRYKEAKTCTISRYAIQHAMFVSSGDVEMDTWGQGHKLFPWVGVAAPLKEEMFHFWPRVSSAPTELWDKLDDNLIDMAIKLRSKVWNTCDGRCVDFSYARFCAEGAEAAPYKTALAHVKVPAVYLEESLFAKTKQRAGLLSQSFELLTSSSVHLVTSYFLPLLDSIPMTADDHINSVKELLVDWIMKKSLPYSNAWAEGVFSHPIIPLPNQNGKREYRCISGMVDPTSRLAQLYDSEERLFPCPEFFERHRNVLVAYGILSRSVWSTPLDRVRHFSKGERDIDLLKIDRLLELPVFEELANSQACTAEIQRSRWLPGTSVVGQSVILTPKECRGAEEADLVDMVLGTTALRVVPMWKKILGRQISFSSELESANVLGWDQRVSSDILLKQLDGCLSMGNHEKANAVLRELRPEDQPALKTRSWILGRAGICYPPAKVFLPGKALHSRPLSPYLDAVDEIFALKHKHLLASMKIPSEPSLQDLREVQSALLETSDTRLDSSGIQIAILVLEIAVQLKYDIIDLLVPDSLSRLRKLDDIVRGDSIEFGDRSGFNLTHPGMSPNLLKELGIEDSEARAIRLGIELESDDEDDYTPYERLRTTISDTLERYSITDTFNEFLANADDAGASRIVWIVDECTDGLHPNSTLLSKELRSLRGPSLMVFNDAIFSKEDFDGFKDIGQGGKKQDASSIGTYGIGAQTLYHFTDVPELLSNDSYLIIDPQQQVLPINPRRGRERRVGLKRPLSLVNQFAPDQLAPFRGLYGFDPKEPCFDGTLFRFPLRPIGARTSLKETSQIVDLPAVKVLLADYLATARIALLFLRNVISIEFRIRSHDFPEWTVTAERSHGADSDAFQRIEITTNRLNFKKQTDIWCVGRRSITKPPTGIIRSGRGSGKLTDYGVAACVKEASDSKDVARGGISSSRQPSSTSIKPRQQPAIKQRAFCKLPTNHDSGLPISFHASFAVTGDRRHIALERSAENSAWNVWLLRDCISVLYLETIRYLAPRLGQKSFKFWPSGQSTSALPATIHRAFWEKLGQAESRATPLLPTIVRTSHPNKQNDADVFEPSETTTSLAQAKFDFLSKSTLDSLQWVLVQTIQSLVRPPERLWPELKGLASDSCVQQVDAEYLSQVFKTEANCKLLEEFIARQKDESVRNRVVGLFLKTMVPIQRPGDQSALRALDKCRIVPKPQYVHSLGTLIWMPGEGSERHLVATPQEEELFSFASDCMVHTGISSRPAAFMSPGPSVSYDPIDILLQSPFNIHKLGLGDLGFLLAHSSSPIMGSANPQDRDTWIEKFWDYLDSQFHASCETAEHPTLNSDQMVKSLLARANLLHLSIYRTWSKGKWCYITPQDFEAQPCILQPSDEKQQELCGEIPDLLMVDRRCVPALLVKQESSLYCEESFKRLLRAICKLQTSWNTTAKTMIGRALKPEMKDLMKDLALDYLKSNLYEAKSSNAILRALPIWRRVRSSSSPPTEHIAAEDGIFCNHRKMLMPWVRKLSEFVVPELVDSHKDVLLGLKISPLKVEQVWDIVKTDLPSDVKSEESRSQYLKFIQYLAQWNIKISGKVAPNGASVMCKPNMLYDHDDAIFMAAFREQKKTRFLHTDLQKPALRKLWVSAGLRTRPAGGIKHEDYLECALAISQRWDASFTTPDYEADSSKVASYLKQIPDQFRSWPHTVWESIASVPLFRVRSVSTDELGYRRERMNQIRQVATHRALDNSIHEKHKRIMWSQTGFLLEQPGDFLYELLPNHGKPKATQVWDHLVFLAESAKSVAQDEVAEYLQDIRACYDFLQENLEAAKRLPGIYKAKIWFNLAITQVELASQDLLEPSLTSADLLCLNSPIDPLPIKVTRKFLVPYEELLVGLGCRTVMQPNSASPPQSSDSREISLAAAMAVMLEFRDQDLLVDVYFEAEGQKKPAHKIVLAAVSEYCKAQFAGLWGHLLQHQSTIRIQDLRFLTLSQMIDFAYTGDFEWPELKDDTDNDEIGVNLGMLLDLLEGTDRWLFRRLHDMVDSFLTSEPYSTFYVRVDTVEWVKERAEDANASRLVKYCEEFFARNEEIVVALRDDSAAGTEA